MSHQQMDEIQNILQDMNQQYDSNQVIPNNNDSLNEEDISDINQYLVNEDSQGEADDRPVVAGGDVSLLDSEKNAHFGRGPSARNNASLKSPMQSDASSRQVYPGQPKLRKFQTYANLDDDPMLMLEKDEENAQLRKLEQDLLNERQNKNPLPPKSRITKKASMQAVGSQDKIPLDTANFGSLGGVQNAGNLNDLDELDQILENLQIELQSCGLPDCGNLRSTKRKDVRLRIKCLEACIRQRQKDVDFRNSLQDRHKKKDADSEILLDKLSRKEVKIQQIDKDRFNLRNQIKEKEEEIRKLKNAEKSKLQSKQANVTQIEQKLVRSECDAKKSKIMIQKLQDQIQRLQGLKTSGQYNQGMDISDRILDMGINQNIDASTKAGQQRVEMEKVAVLEAGYKKGIDSLREENQSFKQNLMTVQEHLALTIETALRPLQLVLKNQQMLNQFNNIVKSYRITSTISSMQLNLPQTPASTTNLLKVFKQNLDKFRMFTSTILNPSTVAELVRTQATVDVNSLQQIRPNQSNQIQIQQPRQAQPPIKNNIQLNLKAVQDQTQNYNKSPRFNQQPMKHPNTVANHNLSKNAYQNQESSEIEQLSPSALEMPDVDDFGQAQQQFNNEGDQRNRTKSQNRGTWGNRGSQSPTKRQIMQQMQQNKPAILETERDQEQDGDSQRGSNTKHNLFGQRNPSFQ